MSKPKLKPCRKCKRLPEPFEGWDCDKNKLFYGLTCKCQTIERLTTKGCIAAWNRRVK